MNADEAQKDFCENEASHPTRMVWRVWPGGQAAQGTAVDRTLDTGHYLG